MVVELRKQFCREFFMKYLRSIGWFYGVNLSSKSANSVFRIDCPFWRDYFENRFFYFSMKITKKYQILQGTKSVKIK